MRILNREQFLAMPSGTLFAEYTPIIAGELMVKWDTGIPFGPSPTGDGRVSAGDYTCQDIVLAIKNDSSTEHADKMLAAQADSTLSLEMDFDYAGRRGDFDPDKLYVVYEAEDLRGMIGLLQQCLDTATKKSGDQN